MFTNLRENISGGQIAKLGFSDFAGIYQKIYVSSFQRAPKWKQFINGKILIILLTLINNFIGQQL